MLSEQLELCLRQDPRSCALRKPQLTGALTGDGAEGAVDQRACSGRGGGVAVLVKDRGSGDRRNSCNRLDLKKNPFDLSVQTSLLLPDICLLERMCLVFVPFPRFTKLLEGLTAAQTCSGEEKTL